MASGKTNNHEASVINHFLRGTAEATKTAYLALYSTAPGESDAGTEISGNGYARKLVGLGVPADGVSVNAGTLTFTAAGGAWLQIVGHALVDAITGGTIQYFEDSVSGPTLADGDSYEFDPSDVTVTET